MTSVVHQEVQEHQVLVEAVEHQVHDGDYRYFRKLVVNSQATSGTTGSAGSRWNMQVLQVLRVHFRY